MLSDSSVGLFYDILMNKHISKELYKYPYENCSLFEMLSINNTYNRKTDTKEQYFLNQAFKSAGEILRSLITGQQMLLFHIMTRQRK